MKQILALTVLLFACAGEVEQPETSPPELACATVERSHVCGSWGCKADMRCNRDPSLELGLKCTTNGDVFECRW